VSAPPHDGGAPGEEGPSNVVLTDSHMVSEAVDRTRQSLRVWRPGCPCGCADIEECLAGRPVPVPPACDCGTLGFDEIGVAVRLGLHCAGGCVAARLGIGGAA
jgi:hypothetical protein